MKILTYEAWVERDNSYVLPVYKSNKVYSPELDKNILPTNLPKNGKYPDVKYNNEYQFRKSDKELELANGSDDKYISDISNYDSWDPQNNFNKCRVLPGINKPIDSGI